jgi:hypothetical protein
MNQPDQPHPESNPPRRRRRRSLWKRIGLVLLGLILLLLAGVYVAGIVATNRWDAYVAAKQAAGEPLTFAEIEAALPKVADEGTAAAQLEALKPQLDAMKGVGHVLFDLGPDHERRVNRAVIADARRLVAEHAALLDVLRGLDRLPPGRFPTTPATRLKDIVFPDMSLVRPAKTMIQLEAATLLLDGDTAGAARAAEPIFAIARLLRPSTASIQHLVGIVADGAALRTIQNAVNAGVLDDDTLQRLSARIREAESEQSIVWSLRGERAGNALMLDDLAEGRMPEAFTLLGSDTNHRNDLASRLLSRTFVMRGNQQDVTDYVDRILAAADDPLALLAAAKDRSGPTPRHRLFQLYTGLLASSIESHCVRHVRIIAALRSADAALAAERFRLATGRFPASLDELVPAYLAAVPVDPFTGSGLKLATLESEIVVYSIGDDGDDGGRLRPVPEGARSFDMGFRLLHPDRRGLVLYDPEPDPHAQPDEPPMPPRAPLILLPDNAPGTANEAP